MACVVVICASVSLLWYLVGYSLAFTPGSSALAPFIGGTDKLWFAGLDCLKDTQQVAVSHITPNIPGAVYSMLQLTFAIITAALVDWCAPVCWARAAVEAVSLFLRQSGFDDGRCRHAVGGLVWLQRRFCRGLGRPCGSGHGCHAHCSGCRRAAMNGSPLSRLNACRWNLPLLRVAILAARQSYLCGVPALRFLGVKSRPESTRPPSRQSSGSASWCCRW